DMFDNVRTNDVIELAIIERKLVAAIVYDRFVQFDRRQPSSLPKGLKFPESLFQKNLRTRMWGSTWSNFQHPIGRREMNFFCEKHFCQFIVVTTTGTPVNFSSTESTDRPV